MRFSDSGNRISPRFSEELRIELGKDLGDEWSGKSIAEIVLFLLLIALLEPWSRLMWYWRSCSSWVLSTTQGKRSVALLIPSTPQWPVCCLPSWSLIQAWRRMQGDQRMRTRTKSSIKTNIRMPMQQLDHVSETQLVTQSLD